MKFVDLNFFNQIGGSAIEYGIMAAVLILIIWTIIVVARNFALKGGILKYCMKGDIGNHVKHKNFDKNKKAIDNAWGKMWVFDPKWNKLAIDIIKNGQNKKGRYMDDLVENIVKKSEHEGLVHLCE